MQQQQKTSLSSSWQVGAGKHRADAYSPKERQSQQLLVDLLAGCMIALRHVFAPAVLVATAHTLTLSSDTFF